jgi:hypothetical protein
MGRSLMARGNPQTVSKETRTEAALRTLAKRLSRCGSLRKSTIVVHASGAGGGAYCLECTPGSAQLVATGPMGPPTIEVIGDARQIEALLNGRKDPRKLFLGGGFGVRGDLRYLSDLAVELGFLKEPL